jgi:hypothetical protein
MLSHDRGRVTERTGGPTGRYAPRMKAPSVGTTPSRATVIALTLVADLAGVAVIVWALPLSWSTRIVLVAVWLGATSSASRLYQRRAGSS